MYVLNKMLDFFITHEISNRLGYQLKAILLENLTFSNRLGNLTETVLDSNIALCGSQC